VQDSGVLFDSTAISAEKSSDYYQYKGRYIVTSMKSGLMMVDQRRAHVRVLYQRYLAQLAEQGCTSQGLLFPEMLTVSMAQSVVMDQLLEDFLHLGFDISNMGGGSYAIQAVPVGIDGIDPIKLVSNMLNDAIEKGNVSKDEIHQALALTMARSAAIVVGQVLSQDEMSVLIDELFACEVPAYTPNGKKTFVIIDDDELFTRFN
jgi:DNA mismatch repair protein MutL